MRRFSLVATGIVALLLVMGAVQIWQWWLRDPAADAAPISVEVPQGATLRGVAMQLEVQGVIASDWWFRVAARMLGREIVQAGIHEILPGSSYADILLTLADARTDEVRITFPEGMTVAQMGERVRVVIPTISQAAWRAAIAPDAPAAQTAFVRDAQKPAGVDLEGYLFPDTYQFSKTATADEVVAIMLGTMERRIGDLPARDGRSLHDVLTLASIIEREVRKPEEMRAVAGVFWKRLADGMALQSDATLNYILDTGNAALSADDLTLDSPYNTYQHPGLPPGPISNPGMNALRAAWSPEENPYWYFLTDSDGTVHYARTFAEHVSNKARYLR